MPQPVKPQPVDWTDATVRAEVTTRAALPFTTVAVDALKIVNKARGAARSARGVPGVPTGLRTLDNALGGLQAGLHILASEPGIGKTALALHMACHAASKHALPVIYASFDEVPARLALKVLAASANLSLSDMVAGKVSPASVMDAINHHAPGLRSLAFVAADDRLTVQQLSQLLVGRLTQSKQDIGLLVIDYLQPWVAAMTAPGTDRRIAMSTMALALRAMVNVVDCPVLLVSALNRKGQGSASMAGPPEAIDLEEGADTILCLTHDDNVGVGIGEYGCLLTIRKKRYGQNSLPIPLVLDGRTQVFTERN